MRRLDRSDATGALIGPRTRVGSCHVRAQGKKVPGNSKGGARVLKERKYRQYMNRRGAFKKDG